MPHENDGEELKQSWSFYALWRLMEHELHVINQKLETIMSKISEFAAKQSAHNAAVDAALGNVSTAVTGITGDISTLNDLIKKLQDSQGQITPEDQATLDQLDAAGQALQDRADVLAKAAADADALTPPPVPTTP
jgi:predicted  nucleic acid-binding Zn-ribbon protein